MAAPAATKPEETKPKPSSDYGYLFEADKGPTKVLDGLLRAIAQHIITNIGEKTDQALTPKKLAAFYRAVGGDYDDLFLKAPDESISYIWQVTGCQHTLLQPTDDAYKAPSIPALTLKGFVRWQSIETLLLPDDHAPYIQYAVKNWNLKDPETGAPFPTEIPREVFPAKTDEDVDRWHKKCAEQLRKQATPKPDDTRGGPGVGSADDPSSAEARTRDAYAHVRFGSGAPRPRTSLSPRPRADDYFTRPVYAHVPRGGIPGGPRSAGVPPTFATASPAATAAGASLSADHAARRGSSPDPRRRSFSDWPPSSSPGPNYASVLYDDLNPPRRHSNPRHYSPPTPSGSDESPAGSGSPRNGSRRRRDIPLHAPEASGGPIPVLRTEGVFQSSNGGQRRRRRHSPGPPDDQNDEDQPTSLRHKFVDKAKGFFPTGLVGVASAVTGIGSSPTEDRQPRSSSGSRNGGLRHSRENLPGKTNLSRSWSMDLAEGEIRLTPGSGSEGERRARRRRDKERGRDELGNREWDRARERDRERDRDPTGSDHERSSGQRRKQLDRDREHHLRERERQREGRFGRAPHHHIDRDRDRGPHDRHLRWEDDRDREHPRSRRDKDREREGERDREQGRYIPRPEVNRRTSSHADIDRRRRERERDFVDLDPGGRRRRWDSRDPLPSPEPDPERMATGVGGRRYPNLDV